MQNELVMLCFGIRLVVFNSSMHFTFLANATQSHALLYSLMLFSRINCSNARALHMSSHRVNYMWSHAHKSMYSFVITKDRLYSMLTCSCISHAHSFMYHTFLLAPIFMQCTCQRLG